MNQLEGRVGFGSVIVALVLGVGLAGAAGCTSSEGRGAGGGGGGTGGSDIPKGDGGSGGTGAGGDDVCTEEGTFRACALEGDAPGQESGGQRCSLSDEGLRWNPCDVPETQASTPLVLSFDGAGVVFAASEKGFALSPMLSVVTDWPTSATPWLAYDRDGNGRIDDGSELFGSATRLASGALAKNGFEALAELDSNGDGRISAADAAFASLAVWRDRNADRVSSAGELEPLSAAGVQSIELAYATQARCDARLNCERERAGFAFDAGGGARTGAVIDVHLRHR